MNHYSARQMRDGRYHYTVYNERTGVRPVGYCGYKCLGHHNEEEAESHYKEYLLDGAKYQNPQRCSRRCEVCGLFTSNSVYCGPGYEFEYYLCPHHAGRDHLNRLLDLPKTVVTIK